MSGKLLWQVFGVDGVAENARENGQANRPNSLVVPAFAKEPSAECSTTPAPKVVRDRLPLILTGCKNCQGIGTKLHSNELSNTSSIRSLLSRCSFAEGRTEGAARALPAQRRRATQSSTPKQRCLNTKNPIVRSAKIPKTRVKNIRVMVDS